MDGFPPYHRSPRRNRLEEGRQGDAAGGWAVRDAGKIKDIPLWVFHGDKDNVVPTELSRNMVEAIRKAGGGPKYTEFSGIGHNSWSRAYASPKTWKWLFARKRRPR